MIFSRLLSVAGNCTQQSIKGTRSGRVDCWQWPKFPSFVLRTTERSYTLRTHKGDKWLETIGKGFSQLSRLSFRIVLHNHLLSAAIVRIDDSVFDECDVYTWRYIWTLFLSIRFVIWQHTRIAHTFLFQHFPLWRVSFSRVESHNLYLAITNECAGEKETGFVAVVRRFLFVCFFFLSSSLPPSCIDMKMYTCMYTYKYKKSVG